MTFELPLQGVCRLMTPDSFTFLWRNASAMSRCWCWIVIMIGIQIWMYPMMALAADSPRERISLNADWRFQKDDPTGVEGQLEYQKIKDWITPTGNEFSLNQGLLKPKRPEGDLGANISYSRRDFDDRGWRRLNLPHDWGIEGPFKQEYPGETGKLPWWGVGWYRKHFTIPAEDKGKQFHLDIDGAMAYATVWLNGKFVGGWPYGYASFRLYLTPYIEYGVENVLAIRLDNPPDSSRWYPGGGIYRNVWLVKTSTVHVGHWGTYVTTPQVSQSVASIALKVTIENHSTFPITVKVKTQLYELASDGKKAIKPVASTEQAGVIIDYGASKISPVNLQINQPKLWSLQKPNLYVAVSIIEQNGKPVDSYETVFGVRTIKFDPEKGFFLNGELVRIKGVCNHHDLGALGAAINTRALERQVEILKE